MRYFDLAAPLHHQDEALHLFPPLLAGPDAARTAALNRFAALYERHLADGDQLAYPAACPPGSDGRAPRRMNTGKIGP